MCSLPVAAASEKPSVLVDVFADQRISGQIPRVFGYSGNIWFVPRVFEMGVSEIITDMPRLGMARIGLGDEILAHARDMDDLKF